jgi:hypothetical protein
MAFGQRMGGRTLLLLVVHRRHLMLLVHLMVQRFTLSRVYTSIECMESPSTLCSQAKYALAVCEAQSLARVCLNPRTPGAGRDILDLRDRNLGAQWRIGIYGTVEIKSMANPHLVRERACGRMLQGVSLFFTFLYSLSTPLPSITLSPCLPPLHSSPFPSPVPSLSTSPRVCRVPRHLRRSPCSPPARSHPAQILTNHHLPPFV